MFAKPSTAKRIVALRDERGSYNPVMIEKKDGEIVALRDERGSYNSKTIA